MLTLREGCFRHSTVLVLCLWACAAALWAHQSLMQQKFLCPSVHPAEPKKLCFVTSIFGEDLVRADRPSDVRSLVDCDHYRFFLFTNLHKLKAPGWTKIVKESLPYARMITQSRWGKFMAWRQPEILYSCQVVFYMDGYVKPRVAQAPRFQQLAWTITRPGSVGLAQVLHPNFQGQSLEQIYQGILERKKDLAANTNVTYRWLLSRPDLINPLPYYLNKYFGKCTYSFDVLPIPTKSELCSLSQAYDPSNTKFQEASSFFWKYYETEDGSWRDQPLWAYTLHHFNVTPVVLMSEGNLEKGGDLFGSGGRMGWKGHVYMSG